MGALLLGTSGLQRIIGESKTKVKSPAPMAGEDTGLASKDGPAAKSTVSAADAEANLAEARKAFPILVKEGRVNAPWLDLYEAGLENPAFRVRYVDQVKYDPSGPCVPTSGETSLTWKLLTRAEEYA